MMMKIERIPFSTVDKTVFAFTTQRGDIKNINSPYEGLNLCDYTGDNPVNIFESRYEVANTLGISINNIVMPFQTHSSNVAIIDEAFLQKDLQARSTILNGVDAMVCTQKNVAIGVNTADCVPIVFKDSKKRIIAVAHAGWRGTVARIAEKTVEVMLSLGCDINDIEASTSISICKDCFEVGDDVVAEFKTAGFVMENIGTYNSKTGKFHINLALANAVVLLECGIPKSNIALSPHCSKCNPKLYFSARNLGIKSGRSFTAIIMA